MLLLVYTLALVTSVLAQRVVDTQYGPVRSHVVNVDNGDTQTAVDVYYGIPFGADTSGANRFRSPLPPDPWTLTLEADTIPQGCSQGGGLGTTEDCLKLNVYAPTDTTQTYPVMVWIYGGAYQSGESSFYPGHFLASRDVIVVVLQYRLGKLGFAFTGNSACPGNAGMWDQAAGIQWVVDNIANFGGDPTKLTVFGESAGATSTSLHLLSPRTNGLFQQAIIESGAELNFWGLNPPASNPERFTYDLADSVGCTRLSDEEMMDCMRALPVGTILDGSIGRCTPGYICLGMAPVVDGVGGFMPQHPGQQRLDGDVMSGSIISGINKEDGSIFAPVVAPAIVFDTCCNRTYFERCLKENMIDFFSTRIDNVTADALFYATNHNYSPWPHIWNEQANRFNLVDVVTDASFGAAWDKQVRDQSKLSPTFSYLYDYLSNRSGSDEWLGTFHGAEINFVFGMPQLRSNPEVEQDSGMQGSIPTVLDVQFTIFMQTLWTNFVKFGNPTPVPISHPITGEPYTWPQYDETNMDYLYMGDNLIENRQEYLQKDYAFWNYFVMEMAGEQLGVKDYWNVYPPSTGADSSVLANAWEDHLPKMFPGQFKYV